MPNNKYAREMKTAEVHAECRIAACGVVAAILTAQSLAAGAPVPRAAPPPDPWKETARFVLVGEPAESLDGAICRPDGSALVWGNAWGTPSDATVRTFVCVGKEPDPPLAPAGPRPEPLSLSAPDDPLRTGFLLELGADLKPKSGTRFATGLATLDAAILTSDGAVITAGAARKGFDSLVPAAALRVIGAPKNDPRFGPIPCRGIEMPGDVYVARWKPDRGGLEWAVLLKGHRKPPERLCLGTDGRIYFQAHSLYAVAADGTPSDLGWTEGPAETVSRFFAGAHPSRDALLSCGWKVTSDGGRQWVGPLVEELDLAARPRQRFYDWTGALAGCPAIGLEHPSPITHGAWMSDGSVLVAAQTRGEKCILTADATDPTKRLKSAKDASPIAPLQYWIKIENAPAGIHFARFDPRATDKGVWTRLVNPWAEKRGAGSIALHGLSVAADNRIAICGELDLVELLGERHDRLTVTDRAGFVAVLAPDLTMLLRPREFPGLWIAQATLSGSELLVAGFQYEKGKAGDAQRTTKPAVGCLIKLSP
jgi:hypothetical protein